MILLVVIIRHSVDRDLCHQLSPMLIYESFLNYYFEFFSMLDVMIRILVSLIV